MKAVIPAAGLGTRLLPATKSMPKEMLPVVDRPVIQYVVEEAVASGFEEILIITGRGKRAIEDHFDISFELEARLKDAGKTDLLEEVRAVSDLANIHYVRQPQPNGLGHAVLCAREFVGNEAFAVLLGDDIIYDGTPATKQLAELYTETSAPCFSVTQVPREEISRYGALDGEPLPGREGVHRVKDIVEKPTMADAPSNVATMGRYLFTPEIFRYLDKTDPGHGGEIQLTDAMAAMAKREEMYAVEIDGIRLDVGSVEGFVEANLVMALNRGVLSHEDIRRICRS